MITNWNNSTLDLQTIEENARIFKSFKGNRHKFVFEACKSLNEEAGQWQPTPNLEYIHDLTTLYDICPKGCELVTYKKRQIQWTWTIAKCIVYDMLYLQDFTGYWSSTKEETAIDVLNKIKGILNNLPFHVPQGFKEIKSTVWEIDSKRNRFVAFSKNPYSVTGRTPSVYIIDECAKFSPPYLFDEMLKEAQAACHQGKLIINSTTLAGNLFEEIVKEPSLLGMSYEEHLSTFKVPTLLEISNAKRLARTT